MSFCPCTFHAQTFNFPTVVNVSLSKNSVLLGESCIPRSLAQQQGCDAHTHCLGVWEAVKNCMWYENGIRGVSALGVEIAGVGGAERSRAVAEKQRQGKRVG